jgi:hypothetical protein
MRGLSEMRSIMVPMYHDPNPVYGVLSRFYSQGEKVMVIGGVN